MNRLNLLFPARRLCRFAYFGLPALTLVLAGCSAIKRDHYDVPVVPLPAQYKNADGAVPTPLDSQHSPDSKATPSEPAAQLDPVLVEWWHALGNSELDDLINRGLSNNPDVRIATFRIAKAKVRADQSDAGKGPTISAPIGVSEQYPYYGLAGPLSQGLNVNGPNGEKVKQLLQASIRGDWRVDLWGELDSLAQSSNLQLLSASFERDNVQGNVAANIASSYIEYLSLNDRIRVARETETVLSRIMAAVENRLESGAASAIDLEQERHAVYAVRATIPALEQQREDALGTIAFLLGTVPESLRLSGNGLDSLLLPSVIPGVPSTLLLRRPDVRMAEARLLSADADIDVARARILPPLDLTLHAGYGSYYLSELFNPQALFWNAIANLSVTIFDGGKLSKEKDYAKVAHEEMVETYVRTIYQAVREVDSALNAIRQTGRRLDAQKKSADSAHRIWDYNAEVYTAGFIPYTTLLDSERTYQQSLDEYYHIRLDRYQALVSLFHALGGGVPQGKALPGKGVRPTLPPDSERGIVIASPNNVLSVEGADGVSSSSYEEEDAWLVELPELYPRKTIDTAWFDLQTRFPTLMKPHSMRWYKKEWIEDSANEELPWYQLYVAEFPTAASAEDLCAALQASHQSCRVVLSHMGKIVESIHAITSTDNSITGININSSGNGKTIITVGFAQPLANLPTGYTTDDPPRIVLDFFYTKNGLGKSVQNYHKGGLLSTNIVQASGRTRLVINLNRMLSYNTRVEGNSLLITLQNKEDITAINNALRFDEVDPAERWRADIKAALPQSSNYRLAEQAKTAAQARTASETRAAEAASVRTPVGSPEILVEHSVKAWAAAWSAKKVHDYLAAYVPYFKPKSMSRDAWKKQCVERISKPKVIRVTLTDIKISVQDDSHATVSFTQGYRSDGFLTKTEKTLQMVKNFDRWLIAEESVKGSKRLMQIQKKSKQSKDKN